MLLTHEQKEKLKQELRVCLSSEKEIKRIIVFGSFMKSNDPQDVDVAIIQDSKESYLSLAMKYRKKTRKIARKLPLDIIPLKVDSGNYSFFSELSAGEVIYER